MTKKYKYYITRAEFQGKKQRLQCSVVDDQIPSWLESISVDPKLLPQIRKVYQEEVLQGTQQNRGKHVDELNRRLSEIRAEETQLVRLLIAGKITEEAYDQLRLEWQEKIRQTEKNLKELERDTAQYMDDLDTAIMLLSNLSTLYERIENEQRTTLLKILAKRIIVDVDGRECPKNCVNPNSG